MTKAKINNNNTSKNKGNNKMTIEIENLAEMVDIAETVETKANYGLKEIELHKIAYHPKNLFGMRDIEKLADSLRQHGQLHNAVVRPFKSENEDIEYQLLSGERRHRAATLNEWTHITCKIVECDDLEAERILIITNLETRELNDIEKAQSVKRLIEIVEEQRKAGVDFNGAKTRDVVASMMSTEGSKIHPSTVTQFQKINDFLIDEFKALVESGEVSRELAYQYAQMDKEVQKLFYEQFQTLTLNAKEAKEVKDEVKDKDLEEVYETIKALTEEKEKSAKLAKELEEEKNKVQREKESLETSNRALLKQIEEIDKVKTAEIEKAEKEAKRIEEEKEKAIAKIKDDMQSEIDKLKPLSEEEKKKLVENIKTEYDKEVEAVTKKHTADLTKIEEEKARIVKELDKKLEDEKKLNRELREKLNKERHLELNKSIQIVAREVRSLMTKLMTELIKTKDIQNFEFDEMTKIELKNISESELKEFMVESEE